MKKIIFLAFASLFLVACGGSNDGNPTTLTGVFLDSPVINADYKTQTQSGVTNPQGEYQYLAGETVIFSIGDLEFPSVTATSIVTPLDMAGTRTITAEAVVNMIRLLQSLDKDGNSANGIEITNTAKQAAGSVSFSQSTATFAGEQNIVNLVGGGGQSITISALITEASAIAHFMETIDAIESGITPAIVSEGYFISENDANGQDGGLLRRFSVNPHGVVTITDGTIAIGGEDWYGGFLTSLTSGYLVNTTLDILRKFSVDSSGVITVETNADISLENGSWEGGFLTSATRGYLVHNNNNNLRRFSIDSSGTITVETNADVSMGDGNWLDGFLTSATGGYLVDDDNTNYDNPTPDNNRLEPKLRRFSIDSSGVITVNMGADIALTPGGFWEGGFLTSATRGYLLDYDEDENNEGGIAILHRFSVNSSGIITLENNRDVSLNGEFWEGAFLTRNLQNSILQLPRRENN